MTLTQYRKIKGLHLSIHEEHLVIQSLLFIDQVS